MNYPPASWWVSSGVFYENWRTKQLLSLVEDKGLVKALALEVDLTDSKQITQAVQKTMDTFSKIDILVNNVGGLGKIMLARTKIGVYQ